MKRCTKCGKELPETDFYRNAKAPDGLQWYCKSCLNQTARKIPAKSAGGGNPDLADFTPRQLIEELKARGYKGKLIFTKEITL